MPDLMIKNACPSIPQPCSPRSCTSAPDLESCRFFQSAGEQISRT